MSIEGKLKKPIFIVGPGRSGTTLVRSLLSAHSRIAVTPETHFGSWPRGAGRGGPGVETPTLPIGGRETLNCRGECVPRRGNLWASPAQKFRFRG